MYFEPRHERFYAAKLESVPVSRSVARRCHTACVVKQTQSRWESRN